MATSNITTRRVALAGIAASLSPDALTAASASGGFTQLDARIAEHKLALLALNAALDVTSAMEEESQEQGRLCELRNSAALVTAEAAVDETSEREMDAQERLLQCPCHSLDELLKKFRYIRSVRSIMDSAGVDQFEWLIDSMLRESC